MFFKPSPISFSITPDYSSSPFVSGLELNITGNKTFTINSGSARALTSSYILQYPSFNPGMPGVITVDINTMGINGCYPNSISSLGLQYKTEFCVYIVGDSTGGQINGKSTKTGIVVATGNEFLPPGYDSYRRIAYIYVDNVSLDLLPLIQSGSNNDRFYVYQPRYIAATSVGALTYTPIDLTSLNGFIPPKSNVNVMFYILFDAEDPTNAASLSRDGLNGYSYIGITSPVTVPIGLSNFFCICGQNSVGNSQVFYLVQEPTSSITLGVMGFYDNIGNTLF